MTNNYWIKYAALDLDPKFIYDLQQILCDIDKRLNNLEKIVEEIKGKYNCQT